ncbi:MAG: CapA family protein [Melioribacteraceae bacterium]|nr:CapA family protein [Melioribacteraceae bacterium]MCF8353444.1 CapA family protein [Melioribacteraceae bacterium]MCF8393932.1 CapA family protein [Melioribacteraceae bacterium]MCF8419005.1 CapA family protein [Melioribacteraceae bacterium]
MKSIGSFIALLIIFVYPAWIFSQTNHSIQPDSSTTATFSFVGDLMCHSTQYKYSSVGRDSFDFKPVFREILPYLSNSDFTVGNLETVFAGKKAGYSGYPVFNTPDEFLEALSYSGFDLMITANNHSIDRGFSGVLRTIEKISDYGMTHLGTYLSQEDRDSIRIFDLNGIKTAILAFSYSNNGMHMPESKSFMLSMIDESDIIKELQNAKTQNPDIIIVYFHFGDEYKTEPTPYQIDIVKLAQRHGADVIIGSHPHVVQPVELFESVSGNIDTGFVAYSLGNFISNQRWRYSDGGAILNFSVTKNFTKDSVNISDLSILPIWIFKGNSDRGREYIIYPSQLSLDASLPAFFSSEDSTKMAEQFEDTKSIMISNPKIKLTELIQKKLTNSKFAPVK